jgi:hypothetical protein
MRHVGDIMPSENLLIKVDIKMRAGICDTQLQTVKEPIDECEIYRSLVFVAKRAQRESEDN